MLELEEASKDLKYLLDRGYKKPSALNFVGNRFRLDERSRNILQRYVFSEEEIRRHKARLIPISRIAEKKVVVDGYNVLVTVETLLSGGELVEGMDGFLRDVAGVYSKYSFRDKTKKALKSVLETLKRNRPSHVTFIFDAQISKSGDLASYVKKKIRESGLSGDAKTSKTADSDIVAAGAITLTSDSIIIDKVEKAVDIACALRDK